MRRMTSPTNFSYGASESKILNEKRDTRLIIDGLEDGIYEVLRNQAGTRFDFPPQYLIVPTISSTDLNLISDEITNDFANGEGHSYIIVFNEDAGRVYFIKQGNIIFVSTGNYLDF